MTELNWTSCKRDQRRNPIYIWVKTVSRSVMYSEWCGCLVTTFTCCRLQAASNQLVSRVWIGDTPMKASPAKQWPNLVQTAQTNINLPCLLLNSWVTNDRKIKLCTVTEVVKCNRISVQQCKDDFRHNKINFQDTLICFKNAFLKKTTTHYIM